MYGVQKRKISRQKRKVLLGILHTSFLANKLPECISYSQKEVRANFDYVEELSLLD